MKPNLKLSKIIFATLIFLLLQSCGMPPPKNTPYKTFLSFLDSFLQKKNAVEMKNALSDILERIDFIMTIKKGDEVVFLSQKTRPMPNSLAHHIGNNMFFLDRDVYVSSYKNKLLFSLDKINWYNVNPSKGSKHQNIIVDMDFKTEFKDQHTLYAPFTANILINKNLQPFANLKNEDIINRRDTVYLKKGMTISSDKKNAKSNTDLNKVILKLRKGLIINFDIVSNSNLFDLSVDRDKIVLKFKTDLYFYRPKKYVASVSFDNRNWGLNIANFQIVFKQGSEAKTNNNLFYKYLITLNYKN